MVSVLHILKSGREIKEIDYLYQPERIGKEEIKKKLKNVILDTLYLAVIY